MDTSFFLLLSTTRSELMNIWAPVHSEFLLGVDRKCAGLLDCVFNVAGLNGILSLATSQTQLLLSFISSSTREVGVIDFVDVSFGICCPTLIRIFGSGVVVSGFEI
jgi:hypothetical protein